MFVCEKCGKEFREDEKIIVILDAVAVPDEGSSDYPYKKDSPRFFAHSACWDGIEKSEIRELPWLSRRRVDKT